VNGLYKVLAYVGRTSAEKSAIDAFFGYQRRTLCSKVLADFVLSYFPTGRQKRMAVKPESIKKPKILRKEFDSHGIEDVCLKADHSTKYSKKS